MGERRVHTCITLHIVHRRKERCHITSMQLFACAYHLLVCWRGFKTASSQVSNVPNLHPHIATITVQSRTAAAWHHILALWPLELRERMHVYNTTCKNTEINQWVDQLYMYMQVHVYSGTLLFQTLEMHTFFNILHSGTNCSPIDSCMNFIYFL